MQISPKKWKKKEKQATVCSILIAVYLLILSMVVFNSGTLSLRDCGSNPPHPPPPPHLSQREKRIYFCCSEKEFLILMHLLLLFSVIYFNFITFYWLIIIISWVFISFWPYFYYYINIFYWCIKCIYVSWPWVNPLLSCWVELTLPSRSWLEVWCCDKPIKKKSTE